MKTYTGYKSCSAEADAGTFTLMHTAFGALLYGSGSALSLTVDADGFLLTASADTVFSGLCRWGENPERDTFAYLTSARDSCLYAAYGPAAVPDCDALFDRVRDALLVFDGALPHFDFDFDAGTYRFCCALTARASLRVCVREHVYANRYQIAYRPIRKDNTFPTPPSGFMTWYAVKFDASEQSVLENARLQAEKLRDYGVDTVWVDWEWYHTKFYGGPERKCDTFTPDPDHYPNGMKAVADAIRALGFVPAIWIGPTHEVRESAFIRENPGCVLAEEESWCGIYFFDPTDERFLNDFVPRAFRQLLDWGYEAVKWDCLPISLSMYDKYHDRMQRQMTAEQALARVFDIARETVGEDTYLLSCCGEDRTLDFAAGRFDGARIGGDIFKWNEFLKECVGKAFRYYPFHNALYYIDPDNLILREEYNDAVQAVSRVSFISLLGTPVTIGDDLRGLSDERLNILRRALPPLDIHTMCAEPSMPTGDCVVVRLAVRTRCLDYTVYDVLNLTDREVTAALSADEPSLAFDYWQKRFLGRFEGSLKLTLKPCESRVVAVHRDAGRPVLLATSRHITCGAADIKELSYDETTEALSGTAKTVAGEPYTLYVYRPKTGVQAVTITPDKTGDTAFVIRNS